ncbi:MAG: chloride channel protein [Vicinamibacteria bacterium]|nr:chloride channel protein [Vicinamibacteria bacterium]
MILVSFGSAAFSLALRASLSAVARLVADASDIVAAMHTLPLAARIALPAFGGLLAGLTAILAARGQGSQGVADVMEAIILGRVRLSMRVTLLKSLGSWFAIATGGSVGREGPLIQFGGAFGSFAGDRLGLDPQSMKLLIAAGAAAGFAAAYNTPLAAILFVLEVVTGVFVIDAIVPSLIAAAIATALTRVVAGDAPLYGHRTFALSAPPDLLAYALLGVVCAFAARGFMRLLSAGEDLFHRPSLPLPGRAAVGGLITGLVVAFVPEVAGNGYEPLKAVLDGRFAAGFLVLLFAAKAFATTSSVASGSPGGVFTPSMLMGGCVGSLFGQGLTHLLGASVGSIGSYALVGMAAAVAASTHAPLMAAVLAFEVSGDYAVVLPLAVATAVAAAVSRAMNAESIYTAELKEKGVEWDVTLEGGRRVRRTEHES